MNKATEKWFELPYGPITEEEKQLQLMVEGLYFGIAFAFQKNYIFSLESEWLQKFSPQ